MAEKFYDVPGAARILGLKHETMRRWLRSGKICGLRLGRDWRIPERALNELARSASNQPGGDISSGTATQKHDASTSAGGVPESPKSTDGPHERTGTETKSKAERLAALAKLRKLAAGTRAGLPPIPDEALSSENLYAERGG